MITCTQTYCHPEESGCAEEGGGDGTKCKFRKKAANQAESGKAAALGPSEVTELPAGFRVSWTGSPLGAQDMRLLTARSRVLCIGLVGAANAGKTTFLALLYALLRQGQGIPGYRFAGSYTLPGWEAIASYLTFKESRTDIQFPPHTSRSTGRDEGRVPGILHLALRSEDEPAAVLDVLFTDAPGEWFTDWIIKHDSDTAAGARWVYQHSRAFLLFADRERLTGTQRGQARGEIKELADRLTHRLGSRPLGLVWTKADVPNERPQFLTDISQHLQHAAPRHYREFEVSVELSGADRWHPQVLDSVAWLLDTHCRELGTTPPVPVPSTTEQDLFLLRRQVIR
ncbi:TRAFAC clade GTPase domain-containing protein [Hymenobacter yonginensis]|uniref:Double-GTPase 2 domain-containing protein n=1 Tax=Hymenobacter yonginensis TaxID=748197 RepID=A0ABY7PLZ6_9BACT|nr:hypothetical protein [Hymenobacter yonginensis]WBO83303.1 hypothetical protein O9Z63_13035 [Hymenobacter yonginensis]